MKSIKVSPFPGNYIGTRNLMYLPSKQRKPSLIPHQIKGDDDDSHTNYYPKTLQLNISTK